MIFCWGVSAQSIKVTSELWPPHFTTPQSDGLYEAIIRRAFPDHEIEFIYLPYYRSVQAVRTSKADLWLGSYLNEVPEALYPNHFFDVDEVSALHLQETPFNLADSLLHHPLGWIKGYEYQTYYPQIPKHNIYSLSSLEVGLRMLRGGRLKFVLDDKSSLQAFLAERPTTPTRLTITTFGLLPLYPGFADTPQGRHLAALWDQQLTRMKANGELQRLYRQFDEPYLLHLCPSEPLPLLSCVIND
ncbi:hypothetical protein HMF8227_02252 [Saliniradius amylolyticus]|uniref:Uncharacterized protein n=1 Tax=Saliniradius amylolyticus TaxID=2183582 RepID=A0A2S2E4Y2_9ALTE|nr:transporter substrate-binding domain-containing protein [Saliniradius amylolyticus]AWL12705.1 hypothetical protein HMF8227_02252 [Saliniradius amylolyticus]